MEEIENQIFSEREMTKADAYHFKIEKMIQAEQK